MRWNIYLYARKEHLAYQLPFINIIFEYIAPYFFTSVDIEYLDI